MAKWIRPAPAPLGTELPSVAKATGVVHAHGITYVVAHARVPTMDYIPAIEVAGAVTPQETSGPFRIGPECVGRVDSEAGGFIDADWYFEQFG
jgi:hypothetical protein